MANIPSLPSPAAAWVDKDGRPSTEFHLLMKALYPLLELANTAVQEIPPVDPDTLYSDQTANLTVGYTATGYSAGTVSSGTLTLNPANGNIQRYTNNGAHTLAPPTSDCSILVKITNGASAGAITLSSFTKTQGTLNTTNGAVFFASVIVNGGSSLFSVI